MLIRTYSRPKGVLIFLRASVLLMSNFFFSCANFPVPIPLCFSFAPSVFLCVLCGLKGFYQRLSAKISGKKVLIFSVSPCLRGGFWFLVVA